VSSNGTAKACKRRGREILFLLTPKKKEGRGVNKGEGHKGVIIFGKTGREALGEKAESR